MLSVGKVEGLVATGFGWLAFLPGEGGLGLVAAGVAALRGALALRIGREPWGIGRSEIFTILFLSGRNFTVLVK